MRRRVIQACFGTAVGAAALFAVSSTGAAQTVFLCEGDGRSFAVAGAEGPAAGCRALADPARELLLSPPQPDVERLARDLATLSRRVSQLESLLLRRPRPRTGPLAPAARPDPFDTRGRTRDLGQDIDRRLDGLGR